MHTLALLISLNFLILPPVKVQKDPVPKIVKMKNIIAIGGFGGIYVYYPEADLSEFIIQFSVKDVEAKFVAELDKK